MSKRRKQVTQKNKQKSRYHDDHTCTDCVLCGQPINSVTHFEFWGRPEKNFVTTHLGKEIPLNSCICRSHLLEAKRHSSDDSYVPKWKKRPAVTLRSLFLAGTNFSEFSDIQNFR